MIVKDTFTHMNHVIKICIDPGPSNPLKDYDTAVTLVHWHSKYNLGKKIERLTKDQIIEKYDAKGDTVLEILPLYLYDHSGITVSTKPFSCSFDSGQVGWAFILASSAQLMGYYTQEKFEEVIDSEVKTFDSYLRGDVYGYQIEDINGKVTGSCWGYIGSEDDCRNDAKACVEACMKEKPNLLSEQAFEKTRATGVLILSDEELSSMLVMITDTIYNLDVIYKQKAHFGVSSLLDSYHGLVGMARAREWSHEKIPQLRFCSI